MYMHTVHVTIKLYEIRRFTALVIRSFFRGIVDICETIKGRLQNRQRVSTESSKDVCGIVKGCPRICRRASAQSQASKEFAESYCIPRIVEGWSACSSRKGGIIVAVLYVAVDRQRQRAKGVQ